VTLIFYGPKKKELTRYTVAVPGEVPGGGVKPLEFTVPGLPSYDAFEQNVAYNRLDPLAPPAADGKLQGAVFKQTGEVEVVFTGAAPAGARDVTFSGAVRNGKSAPVRDVAVTVTVIGAAGTPLEASTVVPDVLQPREERNFTLTAPGAAGFKSYSFTFKYRDLPKAADGKQAPKDAPDSEEQKQRDAAQKALERAL